VVPEPVRVGVAGVGRWGAELVRGGRAAGAVTYVSCFGPTSENRARFAHAHGLRATDTWDELVADDDVEAIVVATPHSTHTELVLEAVDAGKHVFVEKPFTLTVDDGLRCLEAAARAGVIVQVGHNRRRQAPTRRIRELLDSGALGTPILADANMSGSGGRRREPGNWRWDRDERPLSGMTPYGVHLVDSLHFLLGAVAEVQAARADLLDDVALDDATVVTLRFASGAIGMIGTSTSVPRTNRLGVLASAGAAWNLDDGARLTVQSDGSDTPREEPVEPVDTVAEQMVDFARAVRSGEPPEVDGRAGLHVVGVLEAAVESARTGNTVAVRPEAGGTS
jgi:predicted dehydrogenase